MRFGALVWLFLSLLGSIAAPTATAQQPFPVQGRIALNAATSGCIGQPTTPICAVETLLACWVRGQPTLCRTVAVNEVRATDRGPLLEADPKAATGCAAWRSVSGWGAVRLRLGNQFS